MAARAAANNNARIPDFPAAIAMSGTLLDGHSFWRGASADYVILSATKAPRVFVEQWDY